MALTPGQLKRRAQHSKAPTIEREPSAINPKLQAFADAVLEGATPTNAARVAGLHPASAHNVMKEEAVKDIIAKARAEIEDITTIRRVDVLNWFIEAIDMARTMADPANMVNGADKVAKMLGYYAPETKRLELTLNQEALSTKLRALSDAELMDLAASSAKVIPGEVVQ